MKIRIPQVAALPKTRAAEVLEGQAEMYRPNPMLPWGEPVENLLRGNTVLNGVREVVDGRLNYRISDVYPVGAGHAVDLEMYRPEGQQDFASTDVLIDGVERDIQLISGRAKAFINGVEIEMDPSTLFVSEAPGFIVLLDGPSVTLRVGVNY